MNWVWQPLPAAQADSTEVVTVDKWFSCLSEPQRSKPALRRSAMPFEAFVKADPFPETVSYDRFAFPWSEPYPYKRRLRPGTEPYQAFQPTPIIDVAFHVPLTEPRRYPAALQTGQHPYLTAQPLAPVIDISWWQQLSEPKRFKPKLLEASQLALTLHPAPVVSFSWIYGLSEPVRKKPTLIEAAKEKASHMIFVNVPSSTGPLFIRRKYGRQATFWVGRSDGR